MPVLHAKQNQLLAQDCCGFHITHLTDLKLQFNWYIVWTGCLRILFTALHYYHLITTPRAWLIQTVFSFLWKGYFLVFLLLSWFFLETVALGLLLMGFFTSFLVFCSQILGFVTSFGFVSLKGLVFFFSWVPFMDSLGLWDGFAVACLSFLVSINDFLLGGAFFSVFVLVFICFSFAWVVFFNFSWLNFAEVVLPGMFFFGADVVGLALVGWRVLGGLVGRKIFSSGDLVGVSFMPSTVT